VLVVFLPNGFILDPPPTFSPVLLRKLAADLRSIKADVRSLDAIVTLLLG
jgi:hypothetical protein